mmetsp:Transcript_85090/g.221464  ORF Transcript_85090/g.221464 Transcript_85090/m.221464 type:complete len:114 (+) Transcript_85090:225-566(+)
MLPPSRFTPGGKVPWVFALAKPLQAKGCNVATLLGIQCFAAAPAKRLTAEDCWHPNTLCACTGVLALTGWVSVMLPRVLLVHQYWSSAGSVRVPSRRGTKVLQMAEVCPHSRQ